MKTGRIATFWAGLLLCTASAAAETADIGTAAAVVPAVQGARGGEAPRTLAVGSRVHAEERITVGAEGRAQLLFRDGTSLNVGPGSDLVLDRYVYDPERDNGDMAVSMGKGVMRFVGGRISKRKKARVKTPVGTVGIRGGIAVISMDPDEGLTAVLVYGDALTVTVGDVTRTALAPGMAVSVPIGGAPSEPQPVGPGRFGPMGRRGGPGGRGSAGPGGGRGHGGGLSPRARQRVGGFGASASMAAPMPGQHRPGAPGRPGSQRPGMSGPLGQAAPGDRPPGDGPGPGPGGELPEGVMPDGMMPDGMMPDGMLPDGMPPDGMMQ